MTRTWLITGCSRGLGYALAKAVLEEGDQVVATARDPKDLADLIELGCDRIAAVALDVTKASAAEQAVSTAIDRFGALDVVVNNAGYGNVAPIEDTSLEGFRAQIETNLFGTIIVTKAAIRQFREQRSGRFIQVSSIGGRTGATGRAPYSAAKFGVEGFSEVLATEMAPFGVKVTIVEPGGFRTDFAGVSTHINEGNPAYAETVGKTAAIQREYDGNQPGDPARAAQAIILVVSSDDPPLRLVLGSDAYGRAERTDGARLAELRAWRETSVSTDFLASTD
ncbi:oxidoreductase [Beijerinckia sp. L45]|uniref:oxidoreductase n=1 Tax=Beijerinckia sp. L45 TaxID=1641855 RepID=UPI00131B0879|nr:oxidoreductase [Beijerinckia sp. L45]